MNFSLASLCKSSATQIFYLRKHPEKVTVTNGQVEGVQKQMNEVTSRLVEMGGSYTKGWNTYYFSVDEIKIINNTIVLVEHKQALPDSPQWYFENSLLQAAVYTAFAQDLDRFETSKFYVKKGNKVQVLKVKKRRIKSILNFGGKLYEVSIRNGEALRQFIFRKAVATFNYNVAKAFDDRHKHKEYDECSKYFSYRPIKT